MHPIFARRAWLLLYLGIWAGIGSLLTAVYGALQGRSFGETAAFVGPLVLVFAFACLSAWWVCRANPLGSTPLLRLFGAIGGAAIQASLMWVIVGAAWDLLLTRRFGVSPGREGLPGDLSILWVAGIVLYLQSAAAHYFLLAFQDAREAERRALESQVGAREAELRALRAQLNPHFLFNSLNSISALTGPDPEAARRMCQLLGDFLRTSLALGARARVPLAEELALAERYLSIEQVRFGARLNVVMQVDPPARSCELPPLLLQPLVENAVKHGVANRVEGGTIQIEARRRDGTLELAVENPRDPEAPPRRGQGVGLENVRRRLQALDPRRARLDVLREPERFRVVLTLPVVEADDAR